MDDAGYFSNVGLNFVDGDIVILFPLCDADAVAFKLSVE